MANSDSFIKGCGYQSSIVNRTSFLADDLGQITNDAMAFNKAMAGEQPPENQGSYGRVNPQKSMRRDTFHSGPINDHQHTGMLPCPKKPPDENDKNWRSYDETGDPAVFHCGYKGYLEANPSGSLTNECFYDEKGDLVDKNHPYADCGGTPDKYPPNNFHPFLLALCLWIDNLDRRLPWLQPNLELPVIVFGHRHHQYLKICRIPQDDCEF